jgi:hypothetical protein
LFELSTPLLSEELLQFSAGFPGRQGLAFDPLVDRGSADAKLTGQLSLTAALLTDPGTQLIEQGFGFGRRVHARGCTGIRTKFKIFVEKGHQGAKLELFGLPNNKTLKAARLVLATPAGPEPKTHALHE